jgi:hypothetical protein
MSARRRARVVLGDDDDDDDDDGGRQGRGGENPLSALMTYGGDDDDDDDDDNGDGDAVEKGDAANLPPGWHAAVDATHGKVYYYNKRTNETTWTAPMWEAGEEPGAWTAPTPTVTDEAVVAKPNIEAIEYVSQNDDDASDAFDVDACHERLRETMAVIEERCPDVAARALATPDIVYLYRALSDLERSCRVEMCVTVRALRAFDAQLNGIQAQVNDAVAAYEEWTAEAEAAAEDDEKDRDVRTDEIPAPPPMPKGSMISAPPAPPLPKDTWSVPVRKAAAPALKKQKLAAMSNTKAHKGDMSKWAKVREAEDETLDGTKAAAAIEAKRARELEAWRAKAIRAGVDASANPNFVPVGDWRSRVEAAKKRDKLEAFRARESDAVDDGKIATTVVVSQSSVDVAEKPLPPGWRVFFDEATGDVYYGNLATKETSWDRPEA